VRKLRLQAPTIISIGYFDNSALLVHNNCAVGKWERFGSNEIMHRQGDLGIIVIQTRKQFVKLVEQRALQGAIEDADSYYINLAVEQMPAFRGMELNVPLCKMTA
jgi:hypothetical protein